MSSGAPWWAFIVTAGVAFISICVSIFGLWYTIKKTDERELNKWKRDTITAAVSGMLAESNKRGVKEKKLGADPEVLSSIEDEIRSNFFKLTLVGDKTVIAGRNLMDWHHTSRIRNRNQTKTTPADLRHLSALHDSLLVAHSQDTGTERDGFFSKYEIEL